MLAKRRKTSLNYYAQRGTRTHEPGALPSLIATSYFQFKTVKQKLN